MDLGREQAQGIPSVLLARYGIVAASQDVAVSTLRRTQETAQDAGFRSQTQYPLLDEIAQDAIQGIKFREMKEAGVLPDVAIWAAEQLLENPPVEGIWVTHGLLIAGLCKVLDVYQDERLIPRFCEIREIPA